MTDSVDPNATNNIASTFLPRLYRTDTNNKFLQATVEQMTQQGTVTKLNGYIGRQTAKETIGSDVFIKSVDDVRQSYQLEPSVVINDQTGNNTYFKDYQDYINKIHLYGGNVSNHQRLNNEEFYSWDPQISWDKFVNFQNYYWLSPSIINIGGEQAGVISTLDVNTYTIGNTTEYVFTPDGISKNPEITLYKGQTYIFKINSPGNPFSIKTARTIGTADRYVSNGISDYAVQSGVITFTVDLTAPDTLFYQSETDINAGGIFNIKPILQNTIIDVEHEVLGKSTYTLSSGYNLSNGMLVAFTGNVTPTSYKSGTYYVEGVGSAIKLVPSRIGLVGEFIIGETYVVANIGNTTQLNWNTIGGTSDVIYSIGTVFTATNTGSGFGSGLAYQVKEYSTSHEYLLISRDSADKNPWSRANRWVHSDVLNVSDQINGTSSSLDQSYRAVRPIIEFSANLKLFNYGTEWLMDVDLLDDNTTDAFSTIEGSYGYYIDSMVVADGQLVIFTKELDTLVKNNIYKITFINSKIHLELVAKPLLNQVVYIKDGTNNSTKYIWFNGVDWIIGQQKNGLNNAPLFDVVDDNLNSISDVTVYNGSSFVGTRVFSYKVGSGTPDAELKFPLSYRNINNIGDIVFNFDFVTDTFDYKENTKIVTKNISKGYLVSKDYTNNRVYTNGWKKSNITTTQAGIRVYKDSGITNRFDIDIFDDITKLNDLVVRVYINGVRLQQYNITNNINWLLVDTPLYKQVVLVNSASIETAISTDSTTNLITVVDATKLTVDQMVIFGSTIGGLQKNVVYYISSIPTATSFTVSLSLNGQDVLLSTDVNSAQLYFLSDIQSTDILTIRAFSAQPINENGYYEIPNNLQNNPLNGIIQDFTLGEVINHVDSIVDNLSSSFVGTFPGFGNLRDLGDLSPYGTKFVKHSGPSGISLYHITSDTVNITKAIEKGRDDYNKFKRNFVTVAETLGVDTNIKTHVDLILQHINKSIPNTAPYYFSDMAPFGASIETSYTIAGFTTNQFPLINPFDNTILSNHAVGVYINGVQLVINQDYIFDNQGFIVINISLVNGDIVTIYEYENTDGCCIPETPSKLGIWPIFTPKIYKDTTYVTPQWIIQGHDGSQVLAYGTYDVNGTPDYRDTLILELEKRIYNNIKIKYDNTIFDIDDIIPRYTYISDYSLEEFNDVLAPSFYKWTSLVDVDFTNPIQFDSENPFTFNFTGHNAPDGRIVPGYWRGIYKWIYDTDRPNICPWEMLGINDKPKWWDNVYGPAPYTSDNLIMWQDISNGILNEPGSPILLPKYIKPYLMTHIPVDSSGNLINPIESNVARGVITDTIKNNFVFGDVSPVESAWRKSSHYPFSIILTSILLTPSKILGIILDRSRISKNLTGQLIYNNSGLHISPSDIVLPSIYSSVSRVQTAGIINYIINYSISSDLSTYSKYAYELSNITYKLGYRVSGFTSKNQFNLILDSKSPLTTGNVFVPQDDYSIILNTSSPTKKITYSGVIITKLYNGYSVKGYSKTQPYFTYYPWIQSGSAINVGGISENFVMWTEGNSYNKGQIVKFGNDYFRATRLIPVSATFDVSNYQLLSSLPMVGGRTVLLRKTWDRKSPLKVPYNTTFETIQEIVDFLIGYGEWLKDQGFIFDEFNSNINQVSNWETSAKEFMFWTTQNWSAGKDIWTDWLPNTLVTFNSIVRYENNYYRALRNIPESTVFDYEFYEKLDGLSNIGSSVISLSPAANSITFSTPLNVVDDITNKFNDYEIFRVDGTPILPHFLNSSRNTNLVTYSPSNDDGIYNASFYLIQKEHVVVINNTTMFNDLIYDPTSGYKQDRIKVFAYVTSGWYGGFDTPGFIFDEAKVTKWTSWKDYTLGDIVQYQSFYYSADSFITGSEIFDNTQWTRLTSQPTSKIIPNWTNIATQFTDFYRVDDEHFDSAQQTMAQHLIGYQKRQYLNNIIQDDVSEFKFYQGMIAEKGTQNVFNKLFGVLASDQKESLTFYEEWVVRVGQYGASSAFTEVEFILPEESFKQNPQPIELVDNKTIDSKYIIQQLPSDIYLKPADYNSNLFPVVSKSNPFLSSGGYIRADEVLMTLKYIKEILTKDITLFTEGDYVWCTFEWNVYRFTASNLIISDVTYVNNQLTLTANKMIDINAGDYVGITNVTGFSGFYKVISFVANILIVEATNITVATPFIQQNTIVVYHLTTQRATSMDNATTILHYPLKSNELLWTDDNGSGKWATWVYNPVYNGRLVPNPYPSSQINYGRAIASDSAGNNVVISTSSNEIYIYNTFNSPSLALKQVLTKPFISLQDQNLPSAFGSVVAISNDGEWVAVGSPTISKACTQLSNINITFDNNNLPINTTGITFDNNLAYISAGTFIVGHTYTIATIGTTDFTLIGATSNTIGSIFIATGIGTGTGTAIDTSPVTAGLFVIGSTYSIATLGTTDFTLIGASNNIIGEIFVASGAGTGTGTAVRNVISNSSNLVYTDITGFNSSFINQGVVSIYKLDKNNSYYYIGTFVSPQPATNEYFGASLEFGNNCLYIGATGGNNNTGKVYKIKYEMTVNASASYDPFKSAGKVINLVNAPNANVFGMYVVGNGFTSGQQVISISPSKKTLTLTANPDTQPSGLLKFVTYDWKYSLSSSLLGINPGDNFGSQIKISNDDTLLVSSVGMVSIYKVGALVQTLTGPTTSFGNSIAISNFGEYIAISDSLYSSLTYSQQGNVQVYTKLTASSPYTLYQQIDNLSPAINSEFGTNIEFMDNYDTLVIHSKYANSTSSIVNVYDRYNTKWIFSEQLPLLVETAGTFIVGNSYTITSIGTTDFTLVGALSNTLGVTFIASGVGTGTGTAILNIENDSYKLGFCISLNKILIGSPYEYDINAPHSGLVFEYSKILNSYSWQIKHQEIAKPDVFKIKKAFLYNKRNNELVSYLDIIDPLQGKIAGIADQEISYKTFYDPAVYSIGNSTVNVDTGISWTTNQVGKLWWDLRTAKFIECNDTDNTYRHNNWNKLVYGASIDIYEWVESKLLPSAWDAQADTEAGLSLNISGLSLYGNDCYSVKPFYDNVSKTVKNTYYFWVKNKVLVPSTSGRYISAQNIANLIESPSNNAYKYIAITSQNTIEIANVEPLLSNNDVVLSIQYWLIDKTDQNIHSQWKLISNDPSANIPSYIEQKWFDSLCGEDLLGNSVPDNSLPAKLKYGVENRPRQSMFVNRFEAIKEFVEQANTIMLQHQIASIRNLVGLEKYDQPPAITSGMYDIVLNTDAELQFNFASYYKVPSLSAIITDGIITNVLVVSVGLGYVVPPLIEVIGSGVGAVLSAVLNSKGQVIDVTVINGGNGYDNTTALHVRSYSALILSDSQSNNNWSIYSFDLISKSWIKVLNKSYDTRDYWYYVDWYAPGYNQFTAIDYSVSIFSDLQSISARIGDTIKVRYGDNGQWVLLSRYSLIDSLDWTKTYKIFGIQNGTIQLSSILYNSAQYDQTLYDSVGYDSHSSTEFRNILNALKTDIFINDLKTDYLNLFFNSVRYAHNEQNYIDWIVKSSFVKATHNVGILNQPVTFKNDNLVDFENYVAEVKPYRTKVREYISSYKNVDNGEVLTTDFDLPPIYAHGGNNVVDAYMVDGGIVVSNTEIRSYPWKSWYDNAGFSITSVNVYKSGYGYTSPPLITVSPANGAILSATLDYVGRITNIIVVSAGRGFLATPTIIIEPPPFGQTAKAYAYIGNSLVRSCEIKLKFDRITSNYYINKLQQFETFSAMAGQTVFTLTWAPDIKIGYSIVTVNNYVITTDGYSLQILSSKQSEANGINYDKYYGVLQLNTALNANDIVTITYSKDVSILNAADRINFYYNPSTHDLGKELSQLMTGIDYGGVLIDGLDLAVNKGWDSLPYMSGRWDSYDPSFTDVTIIATVPDTHSFKLTYIPVIGTIITVYMNGVRIDDMHFNSVDQINPHALMISPVITATSSTEVTINADGSININIPTNIQVNANDVFVFRESTSDGSIKTYSADYDTSYDGGDLTYISASGYAPTDTIVDGDAFVTPITSYAPEEVVPGQIVDALEIKVFEQNTVISGNIKVEKYVANGIIDTFLIEETLNNNQSAIVTVETFIKVGKTITSSTIIQTLDVDYSVDYTTNAIVFKIPPVVGSVVAIFSIGINSTNTLDVGYIIGTGNSIEYTTKSMWNPLYLVDAFVDGYTVPFTSFQTNAGVLGIRFLTPPPANSIISYIVVNNLVRTFVITSTDRLMIPSGGLAANTPINLYNIVGTAANNENNMIVIVDNVILLPTAYTYYPPNGGSPSISFSNVIASGSIVKVISSYNNNILQVERTQILAPQIIHTIDTAQYYNDLTVYSGTLQLPVTVINENYIWVIKNGMLLTPDVDFILTMDKNSITLLIPPLNTDVFDVITFNSNTTSNIAYMQFKDMLNRMHYKDIDVTKQSLLAQDLKWNDSFISVLNSKVFDTPNPSKNIPGVIEIGTERIEYFKIKGNKLSQLRRATLGTSAASLYSKGAVVQNIGPSSTIPYNDITRTQNVIVTNAMLVNSNTINIDFTPNRAFKPVGLFVIGNEYTIKTIGTTTNTQWNIIGGTTDITYTVGVTFIAATTGIDTGTNTAMGNGTAYLNWTYNVGTIVTMGNFIIGDNYIIKTLGNTTNASWNIIANTTGVTYMPGSSFTATTNGGGLGNGSVYVANSVFNSLIPANYGQCDDIEVFIGGYDISSWSPNVIYAVGDMVAFGTYTYKCISSHISGLTFSDNVTTVTINIDKTTNIIAQNVDSTNVWSFFVTNIRLKKQPYKVFDVNKSPYSPSGDIQFDADFSVDGNTNQIRLTNPVPVGTRITVVKQNGSIWNNKYAIL